ncbi:MAG: OadG family protein [Lachnospiraceae bacterium]|nr:OadG family protein [Lachnospiraceae bacterium]
MNGLLFAANFGRAIENTVMGISIVFCMLLLISFIISLLKHVDKFVAWFKGLFHKTAPTSEPAKVEATPTEDEADDTELVAVITAAIYAYEQAMGNDVPAGGLVVRSIRKTNKSKWQNA